MTKIIGILNLTPDSFSDGGMYNTKNAVLDRVEELVVSGADVIDIGAESTRPNAIHLTEEEEWGRLKEFLPLICEKFSKTIISVDTRNASTAANALNCGADWINDVSAAANKDLLEVVKDFDAKMVVMHSLTVPADPAIIIPINEDVVKVVYNWMQAKLSELTNYGISMHNIILDVGLGFGKNSEQSWQLIKRADEFKNIGAEILFGHSEKSFLKTITDKPAGQRTIETATISAYLAEKNIDYIRVHNVEANLRAIKTCKMLSNNY